MNDPVELMVLDVAKEAGVDPHTAAKVMTALADVLGCFDTRQRFRHWAIQAGVEREMRPQPEPPERFVPTFDHYDKLAETLRSLNEPDRLTKAWRP